MRCAYLLATLSALAVAGAGDPLPTVVVVDPAASALDVTAAAMLAEGLHNITRQPIAIVNLTSSDPASPFVAVGYAPCTRSTAVHVPATKLASLGLEGVFVSTAKADGVSAAHACATGGPESIRGTLYAAVELLEQLGVDFLAADYTSVPAASTVLPPSLSHTFVPPYEYREGYEWQASRFSAFNLASRFNRGAGMDTSGVKYASPPGFVHTSYLLLGSKDGRTPPAPLFAAHPEWFWPHNDSSVYGQLCWTNTSLVAFVIEQVKGFLRAQPTAAIISVSQNDNYDYCKDPAEMAVISKYGSPIAPLLLAVNEVARAIKDEFPTVAVDTLAYQYTRPPPTGLKPEPNVIVRLCSIECNFARPLSDPSNAAFQKDLVGWNANSKRLFVWNYVTNFRNFVMPFPNWFSIGANIKYLAQNGVTGLFEEGSYCGPGGDQEALKNYLMSKLLWDPSRDPRAVIEGFVQSYYGPAAPDLLYYLELMDNRTGGAGVYLHESEPVTAAFLQPGTVLEVAAAFSRARQAVATAPAPFRVHVERASMAVYYVGMLRWSELEAYAKAHAIAWPFEATLREAFGYFGGVFNATSAAFDGPVRFSEGGTNGLDWLAAQLFPSCPCGGAAWATPAGVAASSSWKAPPTLQGLWNSGGYAPAWIEFRLAPGSGSLCQVSAVVDQVPGGATTHEILVDGNLAHTWNGTTTEGQRLVWSPPAPLASATTVRVRTTVSPSWVSWTSVSLGQCE